MFGIVIVMLGAVLVGLVVFVQTRHLPPKAQLICDVWNLVETGRKKHDKTIASVPADFRTSENNGKGGLIH